MKTQRIAAIDIGSNSLKLAIVEAAASDSFTVILQDRERVRLGENTLRDRHLSDEAIDLSSDAISRFSSIATSRESDVILAVATASVRQAQNASDFVARIEDRTGVHVEVLPSMEEARLIGLAAAQYFAGEHSTLLNIDIGGGSTELSLMEDGKPKKLFSMKLGAVGLSEKFSGSDPFTETDLEGMREEVEFALSQPVRKIRGESWSVTSGTSGTVLNTSALIAHFSDKDFEELPAIEFKQLRKLNALLGGMSLAERSAIPVINERRAEVIVAGALILEGVMTALGIETVRVCPYALKEGVIIDYLSETETESLPPVPDVEDTKLRDVFAIGRRFGYEENHALQVATMSEIIFDRMAKEFGLARYKRTLLSAAALLHDVGYHISHEAHHKHSLYLIKHSEMTGFNETEKLIIANVARYHRKALPKPGHLDYEALGKNDRRTVDELSAILRIADGLDRGYESRVKDIRIGKRDGDVLLELVSSQDVSAEMHAIEMKKEGFEVTFGCRLLIASSDS